MEVELTRLVMPDDPRARILFEQLGDRFFEVVEQLPPMLRKIAKRRETYLGSSDGADFEGIAELNPVLAATPWLFWECFVEIEDEVLLKIAEAGAFYVLASILLDHIVDGQADPVVDVALLQKGFYRIGSSSYREIFPSSSGFWTQFDRLGEAHLAGISLEVESQRRVEVLEINDLEVMAHGKVSPIITTIAALCEASGQPKKFKPTEQSLKHIAVASQLLDDVGDWRHDVKAGHRTYFLSQIASRRKEPAEPYKSNELELLFEEFWPDVENLRKVIEWLDESTDAVTDLNCPAWISYVHGYRELANGNLSGAIAGHLARKIQPILETVSAEEKRDG